MQGWRHSGFSADASVRVETTADAVRIGRYSIRCPQRRLTPYFAANALAWPSSGHRHQLVLFDEIELAGVDVTRHAQPQQCKCHPLASGPRLSCLLSIETNESYLVASLRHHIIENPGDPITIFDVPACEATRFTGDRRQAIAPDVMAPIEVLEQRHGQGAARRKSRGSHASRGDRSDQKDS